MSSFNVYTEKVLYWLLHHDYSKNHWITVATEILAESENDLETAIPRLGFAIRNFHLKFQDAVVKPGNVLYDLIDVAFISVDWDAVAKAFYEQTGLAAGPRA
ncbi:MAG: hypothetical protein AB7F28_08090 [Candidatus Margulisiibacteriota bacterium]